MYMHVVECNFIGIDGLQLCLLLVLLNHFQLSNCLSK